jgi:double-stranded uracil-DNA glycosylase
LRKKIARYRPRILAVLGMGTYRVAFNHPKARVGRQQERFGNTIVWVLPNPSGLNANYQMKDLTKLFIELREQAELLDR